MQRVTRNEIIKWINELQKIPSSEACNSPSFLKPFHLVTLGLAVKRGGWSNFTLPDELEKYAARMNLWNSVEMVPPCKVTRRSQIGKFLPVKRFDQQQRDIQTAATQLARIINKTLSDEYRHSLSICLEELVNNFYDHSQSENNLPCLVAAQSWPAGKLVQVAIADAGIGIRNSLVENSDLMPQLKENNACRIASIYGVSSKPGNNHSGYGLTLAKDLMSQSNGSFILLSGNEIYSLRGNHDEKAQKLKCSWNGTILVLEWSLDSSLNSKSVYDSWPLPEEFNEDDFF